MNEKHSDNAGVIRCDKLVVNKSISIGDISDKYIQLKVDEEAAKINIFCNGEYAIAISCAVDGPSIVLEDWKGGGVITLEIKANTEKSTT